VADVRTGPGSRVFGEGDGDGAGDDAIGSGEGNVNVGAESQPIETAITPTTPMTLIMCRPFLRPARYRATAGTVPSADRR
jgi:hypothetical protein